MTATTVQEKVEKPKTNRAMRRRKMRDLTEADFRRFQAESIKQKLFKP